MSTRRASLATVDSQVLLQNLRSDIFSLKVFCEQVLLQVLAPWSVILLRLLGYHNVVDNHALQLLPSLANQQNFDNSFVIGNALLYFIYLDLFQDSHVEVCEVILVPACFLLAHRFMVAFKYASLTEHEYALFRSAPAHVARRWNGHLQLLTGWLPLPDDLLEAELDLSSRLTGVDIDEAFFIHEARDNASCKAWEVWRALVMDEDLHNLCCGQDSVDLSTALESDTVYEPMLADGVADVVKETKVIPVRKVLISFLKVARSSALALNRRFCSALAIVTAFLPWVLRVLTAGPHAPSELSMEAVLDFCKEVLTAAVGKDPIVVIVVLLAAYLTSKYMKLCTFFMFAGVSHYHRISILLRFVSHLARPVADSFPNLPQVQLEGAHAEQNVLSIILCFEVVLRFGGRYKQRLGAYIVLLMIVAVVWLLGVYMLVGQRMEKAESEGMESPNAMMESASDLRVVSAVVIYTSAVCIAFFVGTILAGAKSNMEFGQLNQHLSSRRWRRLMTQELPASVEGEEETTGIKCGEPEWLARAFDLASAKIEALEGVDFVDVGGFKATGDLANGLLWTFCPIMAMIVARLYCPSLLPG